jgi:hypothetical protein
MNWTADACILSEEHPLINIFLSGHELHFAKCIFHPLRNSVLEEEGRQFFIFIYL